MQVAINDFIKEPNFYIEEVQQAVISIVKDGRIVATITKPYEEEGEHINLEALRRSVPTENIIKPKKTIQETITSDFIHDEELDWGEPVGREIW